MGLSDLTFVLMLIIEGCVGPMPTGQCTAKNFSVRIPFERLEQCEAARRGMNAGSGAQKYVTAICIAVPRGPLEALPKPVS